MYKRKRAGNTITRKINSTKDTAAKADKNHYISNSYLEGFIPIDTEYFTASQRQPIGTKNRRYGITHAAAYIKILFVFCKRDFHILSIDACFLFALRTVEREVS